MANQIRLKRASGSDPSASDLVVGEVALRTDNAKLFTKKDDNSVAEIGVGLSNVVEDSSPQLGGNLDVNTKNIVFGDSGGTSDDRLTFGAGTDLSIYHNGTTGNSAIVNTSGDLFITNNGDDLFLQALDDVVIKTQGGADVSIQCFGNGGVELYADNNKRFETSGDGATLTGNLTVSGTVDGRDVATDGTKLDGIESGATADQTAAEIKTLLNSNQLEAAQISTNAVIEAKIATDAVTVNKIANNAVTNGKIAANAVTTAKIADDAITAAKIADGAIGAAAIGNDAVGSAELADDAVANSRIQDNAVTTAKLSNDSVTAAKIAANAVGSSEIANDSVGSNALTNNAVHTANILDDAVTYAKIQNVSATNRILGRDSSGAGVIEEITPANLRTMINVEDGATADQTKSDIDGLGIAASTAATLATARTIAGVSFNGSANISLNNNAITNGAGYITSADGGNAATLDGIDSSSFARSDADDTLSGVITLSSSSRDCLNFNANSTDDNRGLAFNGRIAISADYNDGFLRINNAGEFSNGVYTPSVMRADGGFKVSGNTVINSSGLIEASRVPTLNQNTTGSAGTLDGIDSSQFLRSDTADTASGLLTLSGGIAVSGRVSAPNFGSHNGGTITVDFSASNHNTVNLNQNSTLTHTGTANAVGQSGSIFLTQDGTGSRTLSFNSGYKFAGGTAPTLSTAASAVDRLDYVVKASNVIHAVVTLDVK